MCPLRMVQVDVARSSNPVCASLTSMNADRPSTPKPDFFVATRCDAPPPPVPADHKPQLVNTRWRATVTTLGPFLKILITLLSLLVCEQSVWLPAPLVPLRWVSVPCGVALELIFLKYLWQQGRRPVTRPPYIDAGAREGQKLNHPNFAAPPSDE